MQGRWRGKLATLDELDGSGPRGGWPRRFPSSSGNDPFCLVSCPHSSDPLHVPVSPTRDRKVSLPTFLAFHKKLGKEGRGSDARVDGDDLAREYETQPDDGQEAEGVESEKEEGRFRKEGHRQDFGGD